MKRSFRLAETVCLAICLATLFAAVAACHSTSEPTTSNPYTRSLTTGAPVATPITPPPGAQHSSIADVYVPPGAQLEADNADATGERWDMMHTSYADAVKQQEALLPVGKGKYLGNYSYPWCKKAAIPPGSTDNTSWIWGIETTDPMRPPPAVIVSVMPLYSGDSTDSVIVIRHGAAYDCG